MPRPQSAQPSLGVEQWDLAAPEAIDYAAAYRTLDLPQGAPLREVEDRARLLRAAFQPDSLPGNFKAPAEVRLQLIERAVAQLSRYWKTHGKAPPIATTVVAALAASEGFVAALDQALRAAAEGPPAEPPAIRPPMPSPMVRYLPADRSPGGRAAAGERRYPLVAALDRAAPRPASPRLVAIPAAGASAPAAVVRLGALPTAGAKPDDDRQKPGPTRRAASTAGAVLLKLGLVGLVIAAGVRLQQYRAEHPTLGLVSNAATAAGPPDGPPVGWSGLPASRQLTGGPAPAIVWHQRPN